jgi:hypothetical protein
MALHTATVYLTEAEHIFDDLEVRIGKYVRILNDPHITVVNPLTSPLNVSLQRMLCLTMDKLTTNNSN